MSHLELVSMSRKEIAAALSISTKTLSRRINHLNLPSSRIVPKDIVIVCDTLNMDVKRIENHIKKYHLS